MALRPIDAICTNCKTAFNQVPKLSLFAFQKLTCPSCKSKVYYPLTKGYRIFYWCVAALMTVVIIESALYGQVAIPGFLGIVAYIGLYKDWFIRKRVAREKRPG